MTAAVHKSTLSNGVRILTKRMPHVRSVSMGVWVNVGSRDETDSESGLSHLIEHMIFKGTERRTAFDIAKEFDAIGGHTNAFTSLESTCYHAKVLDTHMQSMTDVLTDIFLNSTFDPTEFERERPVILQEIRMVEDNPEELLHVLSGRYFWGDNPLGRSILGTRENLMQFDAGTAKQFFCRLYQPDRIIISVAGGMDHQQMVDLVGPAFESILAGCPNPERQTPEVHAGVNHHFRQLEQQHMCVTGPGIPLGDPRRYAMSLLNTLLGGNMSSRLFQEIREQRGLAYSVYSYAASYADIGMFGVCAGVDPVNTRRTLELVLDIMGQFREHPVNAATLRDAKEYTKGSLLLAAESNDNQMVRLAQNEINFGGHIPLADVMSRVDRVTASDIQALADHLFLPDRMALTLLGPTEDVPEMEVTAPCAATR
jgi:predicted Zn-dependent peptidase